MKILIVSSYFPPRNSIASLRPYSWAKWWSRAGHDVTVLTTEKSKQPMDLVLDMSEFRVISTPLLLPFRKASGEFKTAVVANARQHLTLKIRLLSFLKSSYKKMFLDKGCFFACRYPDWHDLWAKKAISVVAHEKWDVVISSGWPYSTHRVGMFLKRHNKAAKWIVDWRDLWTRNHLFPGLTIFHGVEKRLENAFHDNADLITTVSDPLAETLRNMTKTPVKTIYNGYDPDDFAFLFQQERKINSRLEIVYTGTTYRRFQDPSPLFEALGSLLQDKKIKAADVRVTFAGSGMTYVSDLAERYGVSDLYAFLGFLPREQALALQYHADVALFLEYENPDVKGVLTGKLFEYLYIAREIWAVGCSNKTESGSLIEKANCGIAFGKDVDRIMTAILDKLHGPRQHVFKKNNEVLEQFERRRQADKLLEAVSATAEINN